MGGSKGGGGSTTNVTGLSDSQFNNLQAGQGYIRQDIQSVGAQGAQQINTLRGDMNNQFTTLGGEVRNLDRNITGLNTTVDKGFNNVQNTITNTSNQLGTQIGRVGDQVGQGFANVGNQLNVLDNRVGERLDQGFGSMNQNLVSGLATVMTDTRQGFADTRDAMNTGFTNLGNQVGARFDAQGNRIDEGFREQANQLNTVSQNVLGGQANLRTLMEQYGGNLDRYYADLARGQADQQQRLGGLQSGLDTFRNDFRTADSVANQQRARLADSVTGGINAVRNDLGQSANFLGDQNRQIASQVSGLGSQTDALQNSQGLSFGKVARDLAAGFGDGSRESQMAQQDFVSRLNTIRGLVSDPSLQVDENLRAQYAELAQSFDQQGQLIARSVGEDGMQRARAIDSQGNLLLAAFDPNGNRVAQQALNIDAMMRQLDRIGYQPASFSTQGLASPFITTQ